MQLSIICALDERRAIGYKGGLLYRLSADLRRFKRLTTGHTVLMGRKTFESLPKGALPERRNIVISRRAGYSAPGAEVFGSFEDALAACGEDEQVFAIGGESVYAAALPLASRLFLTQVHAAAAEADAFFPPFNASLWHLTAEERHGADEKNAAPFTFADYERVATE